MRILKLPIVHYYSSSFKKKKKEKEIHLPLFIDSSLKIKLKITGYSFSSQLLEVKKKYRISTRWNLGTKRRA